MPMKMVEPAKRLGVYKSGVVYEPGVLYKATMHKSLVLPRAPMTMHAT